MSSMMRFMRAIAAYGAGEARSTPAVLQLVRISEPPAGRSFRNRSAAGLPRGCGISEARAQAVIEVAYW